MTKPSADNPGGQPLGLPLNDGLGVTAPDYAHCKHCGRVLLWPRGLPVCSDR